MRGHDEDEYGVKYDIACALCCALEVGLELTISSLYCVFKLLPMILVDNAESATGVKLGGWF